MSDMDPQFQGTPSEPLPQPEPQLQPPQAPPPQEMPVTFMAPPTSPRPTKLIVALVITAVVALIGAGLAVWAYMAYQGEKSDVDARVEQATSKAVKEQREKDAAEYAKALKQPHWKFDGPADYGGLSFTYPKTWDVYVANDARDGKDFEAYLDKGTVPPVDDKQPFALRVIITNTDYDEVVGDHDGQIKKNELKSSPVKVNGQDGIRLDGIFTKDRRGSAVIYKIRDKTLIMQTDINSGEIKADFEALIKTITFNT